MKFSPAVPIEHIEFTLQGNRRQWNFCKPRHPDILLDNLTEHQFEKDRFLPYWAELWPAAEVLFEFISERNVASNGLVCELGCGLGIISTLLAQSGCHVISFDISPEACVFARENARMHAQRPYCVCGDWRTPPFKGVFKTIVASDILYERQCFQPVLDFMSYCTADNAEIIIADPCREPWEDFKLEIIRAGFFRKRSTVRCVNDGKTWVEVLVLEKTDSPPH